MKKQVKINESTLHAIIEGAVKNLLKEYDPHMAGLGAARGLEQGKIGPWNAAQKIMNREKWNKSQLNDFQNGFERKPIQQNGTELEEYTDSEKMRMYGRPSYDEHEFDDFNEQPVNNLAANESKQYKVNESQLHQIIKESVLRVLKESGETHRFGQGKYGLAMDAASKAKSLGRYEQSANLTRHGADAFNQQYGTPDFEMDEYGQLRHKSDTGKERLYRPNSVMNRLKSNVGLQGGKDALHNATVNNSFIRDAARTAKAFPRKKMTGGLDAIDTVDAGLHGDE